MEKLYKNALRDLKQGKAKSHYFDVDWLYHAFRPAEEPVQQQAQTITEKTKILDSLYQFGESKVQERESFKFPGGEITKKEATQLSFGSENCKAFTESEIKESWKGNYLAKWHPLLKEQLEGMQVCRVLFLTDQLDDSEEKGHLCDLFFNANVSQLFQKMISAMKIGGDWNVSFLGNKSRETLQKEILFFRPEIVITLGANPTQFLLDTDKRLKDIHGQFYPAQVGPDLTVKIMPLFSPKLLSTAPNMKKTAWNDMQKAMVELKLL